MTSGVASTTINLAVTEAVLMGYEHNLTSMGDEFVEKVKAFLGDDENSPCWYDLDTITVGIAKGGSTFNVCLWQGSQHWIITSLPF